MQKGGVVVMGDVQWGGGGGGGEGTSVHFFSKKCPIE